MISVFQSSSPIIAMTALADLRALNHSYPGFEDWYVNKAVPDIAMGRGAMIVAEDAGKVVGIAIGRAGAEAKLRCIRVVPSYQRRGLGIRLTECLLRSIDHDRPLATVAEEMMHDFARIFINRFDFDLSSVQKGLYRHGRLEYVFNGSEHDLSAKTPYGI